MSLKCHCSSRIFNFYAIISWATEMRSKKMDSATKHRPAEDYSVRELSGAEARKIFNDIVNNTFGISAKDFIKNYRAGKYADRDDCDLMSILMLLPFTGYSEEYGIQ
jgi:hypothetical protein